MVSLIFLVLFLAAVFQLFFRGIFGTNSNIEKAIWKIVVVAFEFLFKVLETIVSMLFQLILLLIENGFGGLDAFLKLFKKNEDVYGSARFLNWWEKRELFKKDNDGLCIDGCRKISLEASYTHAMVVAPTGGGKTTTYIMPNILYLAQSGHSIAVTDPSGELYAKTHKYMSAKGYNIKVICPNDLAISSSYNPLSRAENYSDIAKVAKILVNAAFPNSRGQDTFWNNGAQQIIELGIKLLHLKSKKYCNLFNLKNIIEQVGGSKEQREKIDKMMSNTLDAPSFETYLSFVAQEPKVFQSMLSTAKSALSWVSDPNLAQLTSTDNTDFKELREQPTILYVIVPEAELAFYAPLLNLLYSQMFYFAMRPEQTNQPYNPIFFLLDEFANIGRLPSFETIISTIRKRKCSISIVLQDLSQLEQVYGRENATTISTNCLSQLYIGGGLSYETCKKLEGIVGQATVEFTEKGFKKSGASVAERDKYVGRSLMTADEIRTLPRNKALFLYGNKHPVVLKITPYYKNNKLVQLLQ